MDLPFHVEFATTGRASCKGCKQKIGDRTLRIAVMVQSAFRDKKQPNWYHEDCFFKKQRPSSTAEIDGFLKLSFDDQKRFKEKIESASNVEEPVKGKASKRSAIAAADQSSVKDFAVEYAKSSRATCRYCDIKICKGEIRISKTVFDTPEARKYGGQALWHHLKCFVETRSNLQYTASGEYLTGFESLSKSDKELVKNDIKPVRDSEVPIKKSKEDEEEVKRKAEKAKLLEEQSMLIDKYRNYLRQSDIHPLYAIEGFPRLSDNDMTFELAADAVLFGMLEPCPECKGLLLPDNFYYKCTGNLSQWTDCQYTSQTPARKLAVLTNKAMEILKDIEPKIGERLFDSPPPKTQLQEVALVKKEGPAPPLKGLQFFVCGRVKSSKEEVKRRILHMGGSVVGKPSASLAAVLSSAKDVQAMARKMQEVKEHDIEVVEESYLDLLNAEKGTVLESLQLIKEHNIADWGSDPLKRIPVDVIDGKSVSKGGFEKLGEKTAKMKIKGCAPVDPESGLQDIAHVYCSFGGDKFSVVLAKTDVADQRNSYYKLQLLEHDSEMKYWIFRSWGRIGTSIGSHKLEPCASLEMARRQFLDLYCHKTHNCWGGRDHFVKVTGGYYPVEMDYGDDLPEFKQLELDPSSKLVESVQRLTMQLFDVRIMTKTMKEFELDLEKMPLGKISKKQISAGYKVLSEVLDHLRAGDSSRSKVVDATNRFYTLIPHALGMENPPLLGDEDIVKKKTQMLDSLQEIEIAYNLLKMGTEDQDKIAIETYYLKLKTDIVPLDKCSPEFEMISKYLANTHAPTHNSFRMRIQEVFKVVREKEAERFKPFKKLHNRRLLWHGSRITNFTGILSQGLRIAPPEAPASGYMFGKGIYFADMASKSANYCATHRAFDEACMLLCEVALGDMQECLAGTLAAQLPAGWHSRWGRGRSQPDPHQSLELPDGTLVPWGTPVTNDDPNIAFHLYYNEFIVYDVAQVNIKYLLQLKFDYS